MGGLKAESIVWVDQIEAIHAQYQRKPSSKRADLKDALNCRDSQLTILLKLDNCFDPAAIAKVRQAAKDPNPFILSSNSALALAGLKNKVKTEELHGLIHASLDVIFALRLATKQIEALVEWIVSGKPASEFDPKYKPEPVPAEMTDTSPEDEDEPDEKPVKTSPQTTSGISPTVIAVGNRSAPSRKAKSASSRPQKTKASSDDPSWGETLFLDWLADISVISQIKSKIKKRKPVSTGEWVLLAIHKFFEIIGHLIKFTLKLMKKLLKLAKWIWKLIVDILKEVGLYKYLKAAFLIAIFVALGWFIWETRQYGIRRPLSVIESFLFKRAEEESPVEEAPTPLPVVSEPESKTAFIPKPTKPTQVYQPSIAWQSSAEDQTVLDMELASLPVNCIVKDFPLAPDEGMPGDLAVSRLQDLINPDKYTMKIGNGTQKILSVNPTTTNLTINYQSTDPFKVLDGSGRMNFFWEDVIMIHVNEIDVSPKTGISPTANAVGDGSSSARTQQVYQCSLIVSGAKEPLTIQCSTPADLKHLVSTMEYFVRASRLAHDTALAGMPYPNQGLRLNNQCLAEIVWANSPADKAGVQLGDMVWSLEKNAPLPPERKNLETELTSLASGEHDLYIVSPADREKGMVEMNASHTTIFNPQRQRVMLTVF
jgi:hypothetical protein